MPNFSLEKVCPGELPMEAGPYCILIVAGTSSDSGLLL